VKLFSFFVFLYATQQTITSHVYRNIIPSIHPYNDYSHFQVKNDDNSGTDTHKNTKDFTISFYQVDINITNIFLNI